MSEQKTAKVTGILQCRPWTGQHGTVYFHKLELDNGEVGEIGKKTENAFKIGDSLTYTSEEGQYGLKFKAVQPQGNGFNGKSAFRGSSASFALAYAKELVSAGHVKLDTIKDMTEATIAVANRFHGWLKEHE